MKGLALAFALFPALASAAPISRLSGPKTVQLPLVFPAAPGVLSPALAAIPAQAATALRGGDAAAFYAAALRADYEPPVSDEHQQRLYEEGAQRAAADRALAQLKGWLPAARETKIDYEAFGRLVGRSGGLSLDFFRDTQAKRRILRQAGYDNLTGPGGMPIAIGDADNVRVGRAFANTLRAYRRRLAQQ